MKKSHKIIIYILFLATTLFLSITFIGYASMIGDPIYISSASGNDSGVSNTTNPPNPICEGIVRKFDGSNGYNPLGDTPYANCKDLKDLLGSYGPASAACQELEDNGCLK